jgi:DNA repair exonuclease SbcCD ATPase subunit
VRIKRVTLKNVGPHAWCEQQLCNGLVGLFGRNGAGKSTFVDSVYTVITGDFSRFHGVKADLIYSGAGPKDKSYMEVLAEHDGTEFRLRRSLRPNRSELEIVGGRTLTKANEIQQELKDALGIDAKLAAGYVFVPQWEISSFLTQTPAQRMETFKHLCGVARAEQIHTALGNLLGRHKPAELLDNADELRASIGKIELEIESLRVEAEQQRALRLDQPTWTADNQKVSHYSNYKLARLQRTQVVLEVCRAQTKLALANVEVDKVDGLLAEALLRQEQYAAEYALALADLKNWEDHEKRLAQRQGLQNKLQKYQRRFDSLSCPEPPADLKKVDELGEQVSVLKHRMKQARALQIDAAADPRCPTCDQPLDSQHLEQCRQVLANGPAELNRLEARISSVTTYLALRRDYEQSVSSGRQHIQSVRDQLAALEEFAVPGGTRERLQKSVTDYKRFAKTLEECQQTLKRQVKVQSHLEGVLQEKQRSWKLLCRKVTEQRRKSRGHRESRERLKQHRTASAKLQELRALSKEKQASRQLCREQLESLQALKDRQARLKQVLKRAAQVRDVFHWNALPWQVTNANLAALTQDINQILEWLGNPFWVENDGKLGFIAHLPQHGPQPAGALSGGQKVVLAIAFRLAVNSLFGANFHTMWLDEPTAGLDAAHVEYLESALQRLGARVRDRRQIVIVTHAEELRTAFDQVITL